MEDERYPTTAKGPLLEKVTGDAAVSEDQPPFNGMNSYKTVEMLLTFVATFCFPNETWQVINSGFAARR